MENAMKTKIAGMSTELVKECMATLAAKICDNSASIDERTVWRMFSEAIIERCGDDEFDALTEALFAR